jgi:hypothetical protein
MPETMVDFEAIFGIGKVLADGERVASAPERVKEFECIGVFFEKVLP